MPNPNQGPEKELVELEKKFWQAMKDRDVQTMLRLTDDPVIVTGAQGVGSVPLAEFERMMQNDSYSIADVKLDDDIKVRMLNDDVAILAYKVLEKLTVDGKPVTLEAADTSTWVRRNGKWVCAMHTESIAGDPFGRDRQPAPNPKQ
jgi:hypothetical protein